MIQKSLNIKALTQTESNAIWALKAVAIFTVFFAHMPWHDPNSIMYTVYQYMGIIGVPIFLYLSGYLAAGGGKDIHTTGKIYCCTYSNIWVTYICDKLYDNR